MAFYCSKGEDCDISLSSLMLGGWRCADCELHEDEGGDCSFHSWDQLEQHLIDHIQEGHKVPREVIKRLSSEYGQGRGKSLFWVTDTSPHVLRGSTVHGTWTYK